MNLMLQNLNNIRTLRAMAREFSIDVLEEMLEKFRVVTKERREEEELQQRQLAEKQEKINAFLELMKADGINPEELFAMDSAMPRSAKSASRVRQNIVLLISMAKKTRPDKVVRLNRLPVRWRRGNLWMIS